MTSTEQQENKNTATAIDQSPNNSRHCHPFRLPVFPLPCTLAALLLPGVALAEESELILAQRPICGATSERQRKMQERGAGDVHVV